MSAQNPHRPRFSADLTRSWAKLRRAAAVLRSEANFRETKRKVRFRLAVSLKLRSSHENRRGAANRDSGRSPTKNIRQITETAGRPHPARPEPVLGRVRVGDDPAPKLAFGFPLGKSSGWRPFRTLRRTMAKMKNIERFSITARQNRGTRTRNRLFAKIEPRNSVRRLYSLDFWARRPANRHARKRGSEILYAAFIP